MASSIIADTATLATDETLSRRPEESLTQEEDVARRVSVMSPSSPTERPSAFNTAQSSPTAFKSAAMSPQSEAEAPGHKSRRNVPEPRTPRSTSPGMRKLPVMPEALTISSADRCPSERKTPPKMRRSQSRGALTTVTFGRTSLTTLLQDTNTSPRTSPVRGRARASATHYGRRSLASRVVAITHEQSTPDAGIVPSALTRAGLQTCALVSLAVLTFHWLAMPLLAPSVDHWCRKPPEAGNMSDVMWRNAAIPVRSDGRFSQCTAYSMVALVQTTESAVAHPSTSREERECTSWDFDLAPGVKTMTNEWNLVCDRRKQLLVAVVYNNLGGLVAMPFVGQMADRLGRWTVEVASLMLSLLAAAATVSTTDFVNFVMARMLLTGSLGAGALAMAVEMFEASYSQRQRQLTVCFAHMVVSLVALLPRLLSAVVLDRRTVCLAVLLCAFAMLVMVLACVEESPRWLRALFEATAADSRAPTSLTALHHFTRGVSSLIARKYSRILGRMRYRKQPTAGSLGLLFDRALRTRTLVLAFTLFALLNSLPASADEDALSLERLQDVTRPVLRVCSIVAADQLLRECTRREALLLALPCVCLLVCAEAVAEATAAESTLPLIRELLLNSILANLTMVCVYCLELYPTSTRATGLGSVYFAGGVCATASPLLLELCLERPLLHVSAVPLTVAAMFVVTLLPETKDASLPDTIFDLEGHARRLGSTDVDDMFADPDSTTEAPIRGYQPQRDQTPIFPHSSTISSVH
nr:solute carrier family 22 member 7-like [Dermacentor andersoni]